MSSSWQNMLLSGPTLGFVSAVFHRMLEQRSLREKDVLTHHVIRQMHIWHGHLLNNYHITPWQFLVQECFGTPVACWMILLILEPVGLGVRIEAGTTLRTR